MIALALFLTSVPAFTWHDLGGRVELRVNDKPFFVYNAGAQLANGAPDEKRRCCYVHPVYAPNGAVVTDDFPKDHWHHRGIFWAWPVVRFEGKQYDVWTLRGGIEVRSISVKHDETQLDAENGWFIGTRRIVSERVRIRPLSNERMNFDLTFEAVAGPVELAGAPEEDK